MISLPIIDTPFINLLLSFIEIAIMGFIIDCFLASIWNTKTTESLVFIMGFFVLLILSQIFGMLALAGLSSCIISLSTTIIPILFQQELKLAMSRFTAGTNLMKKEFDLKDFMEKLAFVVYKMGSKRIGGLIVIEKSDSLEHFLQAAIMLNAKFSPELIETIFFNGTPLHDGAVVIRGTTIIAASVILPISSESKIQSTRTIGTRHRAALGISQQTDAFAIVTSEESGKVSIASSGTLIQNMKQDKFKIHLKKELFKI